MKIKRKFKHISKLLLKHRQLADLSQIQVGAKVLGGKAAGQVWSNIERGLCSIPVSKVFAASEALNLPTVIIVGAILADEREYLMDLVDQEMDRTLDDSPVVDSFCATTNKSMGTFGQCQM